MINRSNFNRDKVIWIEQVGRDHNITPLGVRVAIAIMSYVDKGSLSAIVGHEKLAQIVDTDRRTVIRLVTKLEDRGFIQVARTMSVAGKQPNRYVLTLPEDLLSEVPSNVAVHPYAGGHVTSESHGDVILGTHGDVTPESHGDVILDAGGCDFGRTDHVTPMPHIPIRDLLVESPSSKRESALAPRPAIQTIAAMSTPRSVKTSKAMPIPEDAVLSDAMADIAAGKGWDRARAESEFERFKAYYIARGEKYVRWDQTWRLWVSRGIGYDKRDHQDNRPKGAASVRNAAQAFLERRGG